jgi:hypothetical protein
LKLASVVAAGVPQHQVAELSKVLPLRGLSSSSAAAGTHYGTTAEQMVRDLALLMSHPRKAAAASSSPLLISPLLQAAVRRLHIIAHDLPKVLSGPLLELVSDFRPEIAGDVSVAQQQQQRLRTFLQVLAAELPRLTAADTTANGTASWAEPVAARAADDEEIQGLLELVGEAEAQEVLVHAAAAAPRRTGARGADDDAQDGEDQGLYEMLADVHHDLDMQRYLQVCHKGCL